MFDKIIHLFHVLRVSAVVFIFVSIMSSLSINPLDIGRFIGAKVGSAVVISSTANVGTNQYNSVAAQLEEKESKLEEKESELALREEKMQNVSTLWENKLLLSLFIGLIFLFVLVITNFVMDFRSRKFGDLKYYQAHKI